MRSIMHSKAEGTCYLCIRMYGDYSRKITQEHHVIFGHGSRKLSERYGLKVYLCLAHHQHDCGPESVHRNADIRRMLCREAQTVFEKTYPGEDFRKIFGKSYKETSGRQQDMITADPGIQFIDGPKYDLDW